MVLLYVMIMCRNEAIDIAKGIGIFLVVMRHTISPVSTEMVF